MCKSECPRCREIRLLHSGVLGCSMFPKFHDPDCPDKDELLSLENLIKNFVKDKK